MNIFKMLQTTYTYNHSTGRVVNVIYGLWNQPEGLNSYQFTATFILATWYVKRGFMMLMYFLSFI